MKRKKRTANTTEEMILSSIGVAVLIILGIIFVPPLRVWFFVLLAVVLCGFGVAFYIKNRNKTQNTEFKNKDVQNETLFTEQIAVKQQSNQQVQVNEKKEETVKERHYEKKQTI